MVKHHIKTFILSFVFDDKDPEENLMIVGVKTPGQYPNIVNAVRGTEVRDIFKKVSGKELDDDPTRS